jgi:hypothetical protein
MNGTILLHIYSILQDDLPPVTTYGSPGSNVTIFANNHITGNSRLRMYEAGGMDYWYVVFEFVDHFISAFAEISFRLIHSILIAES